MKSLITLREINITLPTEDDKRADDQRIRDALGLGPLQIPLPVLRKIPQHSGKSLSCVVGRHRHGFRLIDVDADASFSVALDLGTTNLVAALYDNLSERVVCETKLENPQIAFGSDILTRMQHAMSGKADEVNQCLLEGVQSAIKKLCDDAGIEAHSIHGLAAAGNTVMSHLFSRPRCQQDTCIAFCACGAETGFFQRF